jgi:hypothetical protein
MIRLNSDPGRQGVITVVDNDLWAAPCKSSSLIQSISLTQFTEWVLPNVLLHATKRFMHNNGNKPTALLIIDAIDIIIHHVYKQGVSRTASS